MRNKHRTLWMIISIFVLISMVMFSVLPYLNAAETTVINQEIGIPPTGEPAPAVPPTPETTTPAPASPNGASVTATVPETEFNRPKQLPAWLKALQNMDPYVALLLGSVSVVLVLFAIAFIFWKKTKKAEEETPVRKVSPASKNKAMREFLSPKNQSK